MPQPNERMQLTWLLGAPGRPVSVHRCAVGQVGLGSPATQLMRAVRLAKPSLLSPLETQLPRTLRGAARGLPLASLYGFAV